MCALEAFVYLVAFGMYRTWLTPWITFSDDTDHGWVRTPELHRWADSAGAAFYLVLVAGLVVLTFRPARRSGLIAWVLGLTVVMTCLSAVSMVLQQHTDVGGATLSAAILLLVFTGPLVLTAPDRRGALQGGRPATEPFGPRKVFVIALVAWATVMVAAVLWRTLGGQFESPQEDDVISFVLVGLAGALGSWQIVRGREGQRALAWLIAGLSAYAVLGGASLLLLG